MKKGKKERLYHCPVEAALDVIGGKWKALILFWLRDRACRFGELRRSIPDVSERMLTQQLRELEDDGVVRRKVYPQVPPKVEYSLTLYGRTLRPITELLCEWGTKHVRRLERAGGVMRPPVRDASPKRPGEVRACPPAPSRPAERIGPGPGCA
jgi:DNA-binding HxlR family transcriptional regulator